MRGQSTIPAPAPVYLRKQKEFWSIEAEVPAHSSKLVKLPEVTSVLRVDRLHFDPEWSRHVLVSFYAGSRRFSRVPASRFQRSGVGVRLHWTLDVGERFEMALINISREDLLVVGSLDYTVMVP